MKSVICSIKMERYNYDIILIQLIEISESLNINRQYLLAFWSMKWNHGIVTNKSFDFLII